MLEKCHHGQDYKVPCDTCERHWARRCIVTSAQDIARHLPTLNVNPEPNDLLPALGTQVLFHLASIDDWVPYTVVGYYVWGGDKPSQHRVFVRGVSEAGFPNARMLSDIRYPEAS